MLSQTVRPTPRNGRKAAFRWRGEITWCTTHPQAPTLGSAGWPRTGATCGRVARFLSI